MGKKKKEELTNLLEVPEFNLPFCACIMCF